jgi:DNA-binding transcriptional ArsR family regulator
MARSAAAAAWSDVRPVFAALGDETRLHIVERLCDEGPLSATRLAGDAGVSRQALAKHLRVLEGARVVSGARAGREVRWALEPARLEAARRLLDVVAREWDLRIERLRLRVESPEPETGGGASRRASPAPRRNGADPRRRG